MIRVGYYTYLCTLFGVHLIHEKGTQMATFHGIENAKGKKSSYSNPSGNCVEVAFLDGGKVAIGDSKDPHGPAQVYSPGEWDAFTAGVVAGEFDR